MLVLVFVLLLGVLVSEYTYETQVNASLIANGTDDLEAYVAAKSAVASGMGLLLADLIDPTQGGAQQNTTQGGTQQKVPQSGTQPKVPQSGAQPKVPQGGAQQKAMLAGTQQKVPLGGTQQKVPQTGQTGQTGQMVPGLTDDCDSYLDVWGQGVPYQTINKAVMQCTIEDECGKLNLNALFPNPEQPEANPVLEKVLRNLFQLLEVKEDPTDAILDWIDTDDDTRSKGAESDYYGGLTTPYACKNGPMDSINELLLIAGITPELFFDCNLDPAAQETQQKTPQKTPQKTQGQDEPPRRISLADLLTVHGNIEGRINVNTAQPELLEALLMSLDGGDPGMVQTIVETRVENPFRSIEDLQARLFGNQTGRKMPGQELLDVKSDFFRIIGDGESNGVMVEINAYVYRATAAAMNVSNPQGTGVSNPQGTGVSNPPGTGVSNPQAIRPESFRILDWQVIR